MCCFRLPNRPRKICAARSSGLLSGLWDRFPSRQTGSLRAPNWNAIPSASRLSAPTHPPIHLACPCAHALPGTGTRALRCSSPQRRTGRARDAGIHQVPRGLRSHQVVIQVSPSPAALINSTFFSNTAPRPLPNPPQLLPPPPTSMPDKPKHKYPGWDHDLPWHRQLDEAMEELGVPGKDYIQYPIGIHQNCSGSESDMICVREVAMMLAMDRLRQARLAHQGL